MSSVTKKTVELFYDVLSPYSWVAFEELCRYRTKWNIDLQFKPFLLGGIMQGSGNRPPAVVPSKAVYMLQDLVRLKQCYCIPINPPADPSATMFVKGSLAAQRFLTAINLTRPELVERASRELWMRAWSRDEDISTTDSLKQAGKKIGLSESELNSLLDKIKENTVKDKLKQVTQEALDLGTFGSPTIVCRDANNEKHLIFGSDRMHIVAMLLGEKYEGPLAEVAQAKL